MSNRWVLGLQKLFWTLGWVGLLFFAYSILELRNFFYPISKFSFLNNPTELLIYIKQIFTGIAEVYFAFLMSVVLGMIFLQAPVHSQKAEIFLKLTCFGFIGEGLANVIISAITTYEVLLQNFDFSMGAHYLLLLTHALMFTTCFFPFLYALTIYILFRHFTKIVTFEAEVI